MARKQGINATPIASIKHQDRRANIPTEELRDFVAEDEAMPKTILYPRDPSLDPQLVWKGKDEQDSKDLEVPAVPIYIQEKIHPKYIIEEVSTAHNLWVPAVNNHGGFGCWSFLEISDPWDAQNTIRAFLDTRMESKAGGS